MPSFNAHQHIQARPQLLELLEQLSHLDGLGVETFFQKNPTFDADTVCFGHAGATGWTQKDGIFTNSGDTALKTICTLACAPRLRSSKSAMLAPAPHVEEWLPLADILIEQGANIHDPSVLHKVLIEAASLLSNDEKKLEVIESRVLQILEWFTTHQVQFHQEDFVRGNIFSLMMNASRTTSPIFMFVLEKTDHHRTCWHQTSSEQDWNLLLTTLLYHSLNSPVFEKILSETWSLQEWTQTQSIFLNLIEKRWIEQPRGMVLQSEKDVKQEWLESKIQQLTLSQEIPEESSLTSSLSLKNRL